MVGYKGKSSDRADYEFTDKDLESVDLSDADIAGKTCFCMEGSDGLVTIRPMDGSGVITIHGKDEAVLFTDCLMDYFRKG